MNFPFYVLMSWKSGFVRLCYSSSTKSKATITTFMNFFVSKIKNVDHNFCRLCVQKEVELRTEKVPYPHAGDRSTHDTDDCDFFYDWIIQMISYCQVCQRANRYNTKLTWVFVSTFDNKVGCVLVLLDQILFQPAFLNILFPVEFLPGPQPIFGKIVILVHVSDNRVFTAFH